MKKIILFLSFTVFVFSSRAQRFYFLEGNHPFNKLLVQKLAGADQFVARSPLGSDYIINTSFEYLTGADVIRMNMNVKDSVSFQTIFQASEEYRFVHTNPNSPIGLRLAIETFLERNLQQMIPGANADHYDGRMKYLKPRKDKT